MTASGNRFSGRGPSWNTGLLCAVGLFFLCRPGHAELTDISDIPETPVNGVQVIDVADSGQAVSSGIREVEAPVPDAVPVVLPARDPQVEKMVEQWAENSEVRADAPVDSEPTRKGNAQFLTGSVMAWAGLAAALSGLGNGNTPLLWAGLISLSAGIPLSGVGAERINDAAQSLAPEYQDPGSGWGAYGLGLGLQGVGAVLLADWSTSSRPDFAQVIWGTLLSRPGFAQVIWGTLFLVSGEASQYIAWSKFANRRKVARIYLDAVLTGDRSKVRKLEAVPAVKFDFGF